MFHNKLHALLWRPAVVCLVSVTGSINAPRPVHNISHADIDPDCHVNYESDEKLLNWSSTHSSNVAKLYEPRDDIEVMRLLQLHTKNKTKLRPVGTALSPNVSKLKHHHHSLACHYQLC